jgi:hypothetical protein
MRIRFRAVVLTTAVLAGMASSGGTVLAASSTPAHTSSVTVPAGNPCCGWDRRGHRDRDSSEWRGRDWDHRGNGWSWDSQCDWAWHHDRDWWHTHCS